MDGRSPSLSNLIVSALADTSGLTLDEIMKAVSPSYSCSRPTMYRELAKLREQGILIKVKSQYRLRMSWILNMLDFAQKTYDRHFNSTSAFDMIPLPGKKKTWRFTDLDKLNDFWEQVLHTLFLCTSQKELIGWTPHPWYYFTSYNKQSEWLNTARTAERRIFRLIGGQTAMDKFFGNEMVHPVAGLSFEQSPFDSMRSHYFSVLDDYVFSFRFDKETTLRIERIFDKYHKLDESDLRAIRRQLDQPVRAEVSIEHNALHAETLRNQLYEFWSLEPDTDSELAA